MIITKNKILAIAITTIMLILCIGYASAFEFDNVKEYNPETKEVIISNSIIGIPTSEIGKAKLNTPLVYEVPLGYQKVAEFEITSYKDYENAIKNMKFYDLKAGGDLISRNYDLKYKTTEEVEVNDYKEECTYDDKNKSTSCIMKVIGTHKETREAWVTKIPDFVKGEIIIIGIFTDVKYGDRIEWIPNIFGVDINEWAIWTASLNVGLRAYYNFSGTGLVSGVNPTQNNLVNIGGTNRFISNATSFPLGDGYSAFFDGATNYGTTINGGDVVFNFTTGNEYTLNFWAKIKSGDNSFIMGKGANSAPGWDMVKNVDGNIYYRQGVNLANTAQADIWQMFTLVLNSTDACWYINSTKGTCAGGSRYAGAVNTAFTLGSNNDGSYNYYQGWLDEIGFWNRTLSQTEITQLYNGGTGMTYNPSAGSLQITLNSPDNNLITPIQKFVANCTALADGIITITNMSLWINSIGTWHRNQTLSSSVGSDNKNFTIDSLDYGVYNWTCSACDSNGICYQGTNRTIEISRINSITFNTSTYETSYETIKINATGISSAELIYNGTSYSVSISDGQIASKSFDTYIAGNISFYWKFNGGLFNSSTYYQKVNEINLQLCNASNNVSFVNFTFKDEGDLSTINATIPTSSFNYYLGTGASNKTYDLINNTLNPSYALCSNLNRVLYISSSLQYASTGYPQRIWTSEAIAYTNVTTNKTLYLLSSADGIYVTLQVVNSQDQLLSGVNINITREINGVNTLVGQGTTGADGTYTFWLNPDFLHEFNFAKTGFTTYTTSFLPTQTSYTITLSGGTNAVSNDYTRGIKTEIHPIGELFNDTTYNFIFNLTSSYWDLDSFGFSLRLDNGTVVGSDSSTTSGSPSNFNYDVNNQSIIYMDYYWLIDGNRTSGSKYWIITNTEYSGWSIKSFFGDLNSYLAVGMFGLDDFGKYLIVFIIIFFVCGIMSYKYGLTSPMAISTITFGIIFFFDIVVNLIPPIRGIEHLLTYLSGLILAITVIKESSQ